MKRILNWLIFICIVILIALIGSIYIKSKSKVVKQIVPKSESPIQQKITIDKTQVIKDALEKKSEFIALEGTREIECTYSITQDEVKWESKNNIIGFLKKKLNQLKTKILTIHTTYNYILVYDLSDMNVEVKDNVVYIKLSYASIRLKKLADNADKRIITDETHILSGEFTPQQVSRLMKITDVHTFNELSSKSDLYTKALQSTQEWLEKFITELGYKPNVTIIPTPEKIPNNEVKVISDSNL